MTTGNQHKINVKFLYFKLVFQSQVLVLYYYLLFYNFDLFVIKLEKV
jgi:hypothetical protein